MLSGKTRAHIYCNIFYPIMLTGPQGSLEEWGKSLNGLTQLQKFRELGTLMYGDPAQGPSIVSRYSTAKYP